MPRNAIPGSFVVNVITKVDDLYNETKTPGKKYKEDTLGEKNPPCSWTEIVTTVIMAFLPKGIYTFHTIPINSSMLFITEIKQNLKEGTKDLIKNGQTFLGKKKCWRH